MSKVVTGIDDSAAAQPVLAAASAVAPIIGATVEAVHVTDVEGHTARASAASAGVPFRTLTGDPLDVLVRLAGADDVVALAVGTRGRPGSRAGHTARALANAIDKPVLAVPPDARTGGPLRRVVVAMEGTPAKARRLKRAVDVASGAGLELVVVHVDTESSIPLFSDQVQHETDSYAREFLARYCRGAPEARLELRVGNPADEILGCVEAEGSHLLAIGWPHSDDPRRGAVAGEILERAHVPLLLVSLA
jgi:nucleotide-binding universal stress UspA family protein